MVSEWLFDRLGMKVPELNFEAEGYGRAHPKQPKQFRAPRDIEEIGAATGS